MDTALLVAGALAGVVTAIATSAHAMMLYRDIARRRRPSFRVAGTRDATGSIPLWVEIHNPGPDDIAAVAVTVADPPGATLAGDDGPTATIRFGGIPPGATIPGKAIQLVPPVDWRGASYTLRFVVETHAQRPRRDVYDITRPAD